jgi:hypothetical protein
VTTTHDIRSLTADDLPELSQFLIKGFQKAPGADFAAPEVLRWKYLERPEPSIGVPLEGDNRNPSRADPDPTLPLSYLARNESGRIVGHLGVCRTHFEGHGIADPGERVATMNIIDWLGSPEHRSIGTSLLRRLHTGGQTQFALGATPLAVAVGERSGYESRELVPVYNRVLKAGYWLRTADAGPLRRWLWLGRDLIGRLTRLPARPRSSVALEPVVTFGPEIEGAVARTKTYAILTDRSPARLNTFLRFPRQTFSGWHLRDRSGRLRGFAILNLVPHDQGRTCTGKIVDCLLDEVDESLWQAAILALTRELARQGADIAQCYASTPWMVKSLSNSGFISRFGVKFLLRDPREQLPRGATFHLTALEGDYAYT